VGRLFSISKRILIWGIVALAGVFQLCAAGPETADPAPSQYRAVLNKYCVTCHNEKLKTAGLMLDKADMANVPADAPVWEKVIRKLRTGAMPPAGMPRPDSATYTAVASYLETAIDREAAANLNPGKPALHRLNRAEYVNAVREILALDIDGAALLPADESSNGFDNLGEGLSVSPMLLERYVSAAAKVGRMAVGNRAAQPLFETYELSRFLMQEDRMSEDLPFESRGGLAVRHYFPLDGEYVVKIRLQRDFRDRIRGLGERHDLDVRVDGARVHLFTIGGEVKGKSAPVFSTAALGDPEQEHYELTADDALEARFQAKAGMRMVQVAFLKETWAREGALQYVDGKPEAFPHLTPYDFQEYKGGDPTVDSVSIGGPYDAKGLSDTPSRRKIFICQPAGVKDEETCATKILSRLAHQAYRRPVTAEDMRILLEFYKRGRRGKGGFEEGIESAIERILVGPEFLFRIEAVPDGTPAGSAYRISDLELASRLSFFLWSSIPDDQLLNLAESGKLREPVVLQEQVRRMLADPRSRSLVTNFASEWLYLRNLASVRPDPDAFPEFDENLREAFQKETQLFFESIMREDRPVLDLLDANYTFVNERLARHYGIPDVYGSHFRRVMLRDGLRGGLLSQGSILTVTSYANRTAPTIRGKWVLENILGSPPPPPPPNVPSLKDTKDTRALSMRQRMEQHRANPACAVCHTRMDPLGFALENFDAVGRWRTVDGKTTIDPSGALPDGSKFEGPAGLRKVLLGKRDEFVSTVTEKLLTYALGRPVDYYDQPAIRKIMREAVSNDYRWSSLVIGIVNSTPFQMRRAEQ
jgi:mono/diheme cytochrome c family protein